MRQSLGIALFVALSLSAAAQSLSDAPRFEVVSIKPTIAIEPGGGTQMRGETFRATNITALLLIAIGYSVETDDIFGLPGWAKSDKYDITARTGANPSFERQNALIRSMLADRFHLVVHRETRQRTGYELVLVRPDVLCPGLRYRTTACGGMQQPPPQSAAVRESMSHGRPIECGSRPRQGERVANGGDTMDNLARRLSGPADGVVINKTELAGQFDVDFSYSVVGDPDPTAPSVFAAVEEQLGFKLNRTQVEVPTVVVERLERPTPD